MVSLGERSETNDQIEKAAFLASQLLEFLTQQLNALKSEEDSDAFSEVRIKTALLISKGIQSMEDLIKRMDAAAHEAKQYPQNLVEFSKKLEKQIAIIANAAGNKKLPKKPKRV